MFRYVNLRVILITLAFGLASVRFVEWAEAYLEQIYIDLPKASAEVLEVNVDSDLMGLVMVGHGCGGRNKYGGEGYITGYVWDGVSVSTSGASYDTRALARRDLSLRVQESKEVVEDSRRSDPTALPVRLVLRHEDDAVEYFEIAAYDGGDFVKDIVSRDLATALRFELWEKQSQRQRQRLDLERR